MRLTRELYASLDNSRPEFSKSWSRFSFHCHARKSVEINCISAYHAKRKRGEGRGWKTRGQAVKVTLSPNSLTRGNCQRFSCQQCSGFSQVIIIHGGISQPLEWGKYSRGIKLFKNVDQPGMDSDLGGDSGGFYNHETHWVTLGQSRCFSETRTDSEKLGRNGVSRKPDRALVKSAIHVDILFT